MRFRTAYVAFPSRAETPPQTAPETPLTIAGLLRVPDLDAEGAPRSGVPAVLICHGSDGVDGRGRYHAEALEAAGFATLEIDMWAARGTARGAKARPASVPQTLADAFAALAFLATQPEVDPSRIAIVGFSWGGVVSLLCATRAYADRLGLPGQRFVAHAAFYPVLWSYNHAPGYELRDLTGAAVLIEVGADDAYDDPEVCAGFLAALDPQTRAGIRMTVHAGATHAFDRAQEAKVIHDPAAHKGRGGPVRFEHNPSAAAAAREELVTFMAAAFESR